jgi:hypothetical protein
MLKIRIFTSNKINSLCEVHARGYGIVNAVLGK